ncbi:hypothetical protein B0H16DRAFT_1466014 [Mycena metata]|uniref:Uncharacterized protein n=1 Tax=Mycena metata TaxID=1033252 RepID=A0AAD7IB75_9AGAR|nr:hypothetical protein B0H16DRAFT_1466014 [Mycena metata]
MLDTTLLLAFSFTSLLTTIPGVGAQCPQTAGYLGAFDSFTGDFIGAVRTDSWVTNLLFLKVPELSTSNRCVGDLHNPSNYLAVFPFTNSTNEGDAALLQILNPGDPNAPFVSLVIGIADCTRNAFSNALTSFAIITASHPQ